MLVIDQVNTVDESNYLEFPDSCFFHIIFAPAGCKKATARDATS
jgi:hypothetical protein